MSETTTVEPDAEVEVRYLSPPEYVKAANARDQRVKHNVDLHHFFAYLQNSAGLLREVPAEKIDLLVEEYLNEDWS